MKLTKNGQVPRLCVVFYALINLAALIFACMYVLPPFNQMGWFSVSAIIDNGQPFIWALLIIAAALYCAWSVYLIVNALSRKPRIDKSSVSLQSGETGSVRVSIAALDTLVKEAVNNVRGVGDIKTYIINHEDSITVKIEMELLSDEHIPNVTMLMQRDIKNFIEEYSGIAVREVSIMVLAIKIPEKPHAEDRERGNFQRAERVFPLPDEAPVEISPVMPAEEETPEAVVYEPVIEEPLAAEVYEPVVIEEPQAADEPEEPECEIDAADASDDEPIAGDETEQDTETERETEEPEFESNYL